MVAHATRATAETEADRVWFAVLLPVAASLLLAFGLIAFLTRDDLKKEPLLSLAAITLTYFPVCLPALVLNGLLFRKGVRSRGSWFASGAACAVAATLITLGSAIVLIKFVRLGMSP